jgi:hypothetical protein
MVLGVSAWTMTGSGISHADAGNPHVAARTLVPVERSLTENTAIDRRRASTAREQQRQQRQRTQGDQLRTAPMNEPPLIKAAASASTMSGSMPPGDAR